MSSTTLDLTVTADARAAMRGLQGLSSSLEEVTQDAARTEAALSDLDNPIRIRVEDEALQNSRQEIQRLQAEIAEQLRLDINADTRVAQRRITQLRSAIRELERNRVDIEVDVDTSEIDDLTESAGGLGDSFSGIGRGLSKLASGTGPVLGSIVGVFAGLAIGAGAVATATIGMADQMANAKIAFDQFLGSGEKADKFLQDLAQFAAKTPFEFSDLVGASKTLLAFGLESEDVVKTMTLLGDAAALTGSEVGNLTEIWGEMVAVGDIGNDTLLELTTNGIPAYKILAQEMGKTPAQIQKMASEGKLLTKNVLPKLEAGLRKAFGGGMVKLSETLTGKISTLQDTLSTIGVDVGEALLPFAQTIVDKVQPALTGLSEWAAANKGAIALSITDGIAAALEFGAGLLDMFGMISVAIGDVIGWVGDLTISIGTALQAMSDLPGVADDLGDGTVAAGENMKRLGETARGTKDEFTGMADDLRTAAGEVRGFGQEIADGFKLEGLKDSLESELAGLEELKQKPPTIEVQADITAARQRISALRAEVETETNKQRLVNINVRVTDKREQLHEIEAALENLRHKKATPQVRLDIKEWTSKRKQVAGELATLKAQRAKIPVDANTASAHEKLANLNRTINDTTRDRDSRISVTTSGVGTAENGINHAARDRTATIKVKYKSDNDAPGENSGTRASQTGIVPQLFGADSRTVAGLRAAALGATAMVATTMAPGGTQRGAGATTTVTQLRPKETPIKVYLDGAEIADHLTLKAGRMATATSVRRRA